MDKSNEALVQLLTHNDPLTSVESQTQNLKLDANLVHPVAYISDSFTESQSRGPTITKECFGIFMSIKKAHFIYRFLMHSDHKPLQKSSQVILITKNVAHRV